MNISHGRCWRFRSESDSARCGISQPRARAARSRSDHVTARPVHHRDARGTEPRGGVAEASFCRSLRARLRRWGALLGDRAG